MTAEDLWIAGIVAVLCLGIFLPVGVLAYRRMKAVGREWRIFAERRGFSVDDSAGSDRLPVVQGRAEGRVFRLGRFTETASSSGRMSMELEIRGRIPEGLYLHGDHFSSGLVKALVVRDDFDIGDEEFDKNVIVGGGNLSEIRGYLHKGRRSAVLELIGEGGFVKDSKVILHSERNISEQAELDRRLDLLHRTARELDGEAGS